MTQPTPTIQERIDRDVVADLHRIRITQNLRTISDAIRFLMDQKDAEKGDTAYK